MSHFEPLTEDDLTYTKVDGEEIPATWIGEEGEWIVSYGHIDSDSMFNYCRSLILESGEDPDDEELYDLNDPASVVWAWADRRTPDDVDEWIIGWDGVDEDTPNSFPITMVNLW